MFVEEATIEIAGTTVVTEIVIPFDVADPDEVVVSTQVMISLFNRVEIENVLLLVPTFTPFFFH